MAPKSIKEVLQNDVLTEDMQVELNEAFEKRVAEEREIITAELREEFANRYDHDKSMIIEAMDALLKDVVKKELTEFASDKAKMRESKKKYDKAMKEHRTILNKFITENLKKELVELKKDMSGQKQNFKKLEEFVIQSLAKELNEFYEDKKQLVEQKVKVIRDGKQVIKEAKRNFVKKTAAQLGVLVEDVMKKEITKLHSDIKLAKENEFGRKIFETFASEFMASNLCESTQFGKIARELTATKEKLAEADKKLKSKNKALLESKRSVKVARDVAERKTILGELLAPLTDSQKDVMKTLLESVRTGDLPKAFKKYLPTVLSEKTGKEAPKGKQKLTENETNDNKVELREVNGDKQTSIQSETERSADIIRLKELAGIPPVNSELAS